MTDSDFWQNPFAGIHTKRQLIDACIHSRLVLDVDTSSILSGVQIAECTHEALKGFVLSELQKMRGSITAVDEVDENDVVSFPMKRGEYMIFSERTLHGSTANRSSRDRLAINFRIALSSTLIYPSRLRGDFIDGFNLDISRHESVLLCGESLNPDNRIKDP